MRIRLVSHASVIIDTGCFSIWTDPWLFGKANNDSWSLFPGPFFESEYLDRISYLWISNACSDRLHVPTLSWLPQPFKERVILLLQENRLFPALASTLKQLGFKNIIPIAHRQIIELNNDCLIYGYQVGRTSSSLAIYNRNEMVLNLNTAEPDKRDCTTMLNDIGPPKVVLNGFSIGRSQDAAKNKLRSMARNHVDLKAKYSVPFANFMYFSSSNNRYVNRFANSIQSVYQFFDERGLKSVILYPGDVFDTSKEHDSTPALKKFAQARRSFKHLPYDAIQSVTIEALKTAFLKFNQRLRKHFPSPFLFCLGRLKVFLPDLRTALAFSVRHQTVVEIDKTDRPDLVVDSQALWFAFEHPFGIEALDASARLKVYRKAYVWRWYGKAATLSAQEPFIKKQLLASH